jgi:hypothetical protein
MSKPTAWTYIIGLLCLLTSCYSFDKEVALKEFKELQPNGEIVKMTDYECSGTLGSCWYVEIKYKHKDTGTVSDTTFQYWQRDGKWLTNTEYKKLTD